MGLCWRTAGLNSTSFQLHCAWTWWCGIPIRHFAPMAAIPMDSSALEYPGSGNFSCPRPDDGKCVVRAMRDLKAGEERWQMDPGNKWQTFFADNFHDHPCSGLGGAKELWLCPYEWGVKELQYHQSFPATLYILDDQEISISASLPMTGFVHQLWTRWTSGLACGTSTGAPWQAEPDACRPVRFVYPSASEHINGKSPMNWVVNGQNHQWMGDVPLIHQRVIAVSILCSKRVPCAKSKCFASCARFLEEQNGFVCQCPRCRAEATPEMDSGKKRGWNLSGLE